MPPGWEHTFHSSTSTSTHRQSLQLCRDDPSSDMTSSFDNVSSAGPGGLGAPWPDVFNLSIAKVSRAEDGILAITQTPAMRCRRCSENIQVSGQAPE
jgi:hypothetical protein